LRRTIFLLTAAAAVVATMLASTSLAVAQGNPQGHPEALEGAIDVDPACATGQGETSGDRRPQHPTTKPEQRVFGAVHEREEGGFGIPVPECSVPLPSPAL
jgi:hypothetical protein